MPNRHSPPLLVLSTLFAFVVVTGGCSKTAATTTTSATTTSATTTSATTTSAAAVTTSTIVTSTRPIRQVVALGTLPTPLLEELAAVFSYVTDPRNEATDTPDGLVSYLRDGATPGLSLTVFTGSWVELQNGETVAVISRQDDTLFAVKDTNGWHIVGAQLGDSPPWLGNSPRMLLILGSDARIGQNQLRFRADSIHVLTLVPEQAVGTIIGIPRDAWVDGPDGGIKFSSLMASRGPEIMLKTARDLTSLPIEGYVITGFKGFEGLMTALGGLIIDLPRNMRTGNNWTNFSAGLKHLSPIRALQLARIRKGLPGGDFARSENHGLIMQAAMAMIQDAGIGMLPDWLFILLEHAWTDLTTEHLLTWAAGAYYLDPENLVNFVLPGRVANISGASVVLLDDDVESIFRDLDDGVLSDEYTIER